MGLTITDNNCPDNGLSSQPNVFTVQVENAPGDILGTDVYLKEVQLIILHEWAGDLDIKLAAPNGIEVNLTSDNGGDENDYGSLNFSDCQGFTLFSYGACNSITDGEPPFLNGPYQPEEGFFRFNDGLTNPNAAWQLQICDDVAEDTGTLEYVNLVFEPIACLPVTLPFVAAVDTTSVTLDWEHPEGVACATTLIEYGPPGFTPGEGLNANGTLVELNQCPPVTIAGFAGETTYDIYIRKQCAGNSFSENSCPVVVTTGCSPPPPTIIENFENTLPCRPNCGEVCPIDGFWRNSSNDDFDWITLTGPTPTIGTGPDGDVSGDGQFIYLEVSGGNCNDGNLAYLLSNCVRIDKANSDTCHFSFNYHMQGNDVGSLSLEVTTDGGFSWRQLWEKSGDQGAAWKKVYLGFDQLQNGEVAQFRFTGTGGSGPKGDIAIDGIVFYGTEDLGAPANQFFVDNDGDGFGNPEVFIFSCEPTAPEGFASLPTDCDDSDELVNPDAAEVPCDGIDNNCNGTEDDIVLPPPSITNDTICSEEAAQVCATAGFNRPIFWYGSPDGNDLLGFGECYVPEIPENNSPFPVTYRFYAEETDFFCRSVERAVATVTVLPQPKLELAETPVICRNESLDLNSLSIEESNFTGAGISFHSSLPPTDENRLTSTIVSPAQSSIYYAVATTDGGCTDDALIQVTVRGGPIVEFSPSDTFSICRETSTTLAANVTNGAGNYNYQWSNGSTEPAIEVEADFFSGAVDHYVVTVTDETGCSAVDSARVTTTSSIDSIQRIINNVTTCSGNNGSVTLTPLNGVSPFRYIWQSNNGITGEFTSNEDRYTIENLTQGAYRITITDNSTGACDFVLRSVIVNGPDAVVNSSTITNVSCKGASDGTICVDVSGANLEYIWSTGATTECIENLLPGSYSVTITEGTCQTVLSDLLVEEPEELSTFTTLQPPTCSDLNDGAIDLTVFGGNGGYTFQWDTGAQSEDLTGIGSGSYSFTLTDANNCELVDSVILEAPDSLSIVLDQLSDVSCSGLRDAFIRVNGNGGVPPYQYTWDNGQTTSLLAGIGAGNYSVTITDFNGCTAMASYTIEEPVPLIAQVEEVIAPDCIGDINGRISISTSGGTPPYRFDWQNGITDSVLTNIGVGNYQVIIADGNNCYADTIAVELNAQSVVDLAATVDAPTCIGLDDGSISIQPSGTAPFTFNWAGGQNTANLSGVTAGSYPVTVVDAQGCRLDTAIQVEAPQVFDVEFAVFQPSCFGSDDGVINVNLLQSGEAPLAFRWSTGGVNQSLVGIAEGAYVLTVTDGLGCHYISDTINIENPPPLRLSVDGIGTINCFDDSTGFIETTTTGGAPPYNYNWIGLEASSDDLFELPAGDYRLLIRDANDCPIDTTFRLTQPEELKARVEVDAGDICIATSANRLSSTVTGGVKPYFFTWSNGSTAEDLVDIASGDYNLLVSDDNGCTDTVPSIKLRSQITPLTLDSFYVTSSSCSGSNDGSMTAVISGGSTNYRFHFSNNDIRETQARRVTSSNLRLNQSYRVTVTDLTTGCSVVSDLEEATEPAPLLIVRDSLSVIECAGENDGAIYTRAIGGVSPYRYEWYNQDSVLVDTVSSLLNVPAGNYTLVVTDANSCTDTLPQTRIISRNPPIRLIDSLTVVNHVICKGGNDGNIRITTAGGVKPYQFRWSNGAVSEDLSQIRAGSYAITVADAIGCVATFPAITVNEPADSISLTAELVPPSCHDEFDGAISTTLSGGVTPYAIRWRLEDVLLSKETDTDLDSLSGGKYFLLLEDANGCQFQDSFNLVAPTPITLEIKTLPTTSPDEFGGLSATAMGGTPPYIFFWNTNDTTQTTMDLENGAYSLTVTDANGCSIDTSTVLVSVNDSYSIESYNLYPNPTYNNLQLALSLNEPLDIQVSILNVLGQPVIRERKTGFRQGTWQFDLAPFDAGIYLLQVRTKQQTILTEKVILLE